MNAQASILPGGRIVHPLGIQIDTVPGTFGLAISPKGIVAVTGIGYEAFGIATLNQQRATWNESLFWARLPSDIIAPSGDAEWRGVSYGAAFENEKSLWISEGDSGRVRELDPDTGSRRRILSLDDSTWRNSFAADLAIDAGKHLLYVLDPANFRTTTLDTVKGRIVSSVAVGLAPFALSLSPDGSTLWVANSGTYQYHTEAGGAFPPNLSKALGDPTNYRGNSVVKIDVSDPAAPKVVAWVPTGTPIGEDAVGGSAPGFVLATADGVFVSNSHSDTVSILNPATAKLEVEIPLEIPGLEDVRGVIPAGMAYDSADKWLFVAESGINAVGVIDVANRKVIAHLPAGWYPVRVAIYGNRVWVANARGRGAGLWTGSEDTLPPAMPTVQRGSVNTFEIPAAKDLPASTTLTFSADGFFARRDTPAPAPSGIHHVVLIVKENRSYDEVLGDVAGASNGQASGDPSLARYGMNGSAHAEGLHFSLKNVAVTPNQHAIAQQFAFSDNFYSDADTDAGGHHWLTGVYPDPMTLAGIFAGWGGEQRFIADDASPGRLAFAEKHASVLPDGIPENGAIWDHFAANGVSFRNFGEGLDLPGARRTAGAVTYTTDIPLAEPLRGNTEPGYHGFEAAMGDQQRADAFIAALKKEYGAGKADLPQFIYLTLPGDHENSPDDSRGYPYAASWIADNDLALGRVLEYLSGTPWWRDMAVFVTEDNAYGGQDHIDPHRTLLFAAGPYIKRDYVSHTNASFPSLLRTIFELLKLPPLNLFDATASRLTDIFTTTPDYTPFKAVQPEKRVFDPAAAK